MVLELSYHEIISINFDLQTSDSSQFKAQELACTTQKETFFCICRMWTVTVARVESTLNQKEMMFSVIMEMVSLLSSLLFKKTAMIHL